MIVVGAGFAGLRAVRALRKAPVRVTLIDRHNYQTFQPLLYQVATAGLNVADVAFPIRGVIRRYKNCSFRRAVVSSVDHDRRVVHLKDGEALTYDYLIVGGGARAAYFGVPGAEEHAFALYSLADATRLRNHILRCVELADAHPELIERGLLTFVIVGGGPTGVEMAEVFSRCASVSSARTSPRCVTTRCGSSSSRCSMSCWRRSGRGLRRMRSRPFPSAV